MIKQWVGGLGHEMQGLGLWFWAVSLIGLIDVHCLLGGSEKTLTIPHSS